MPTKHEKVTALIKRIKRDYPLMTSCDMATLILEELGIDDNMQMTTSESVVFNSTYEQ